MTFPTLPTERYSRWVDTGRSAASATECEETTDRSTHTGSCLSDTGVSSQTAEMYCQTVQPAPAHEV